MADFFRHPNSILPQFKKGYLDIGETLVKFNYYKLKRKDIQRIELISNIAMQRNQIIIATTSSLPFNIQSFVQIDNEQYTIADEYTEDAWNENNIFNFKSDTPIKYFILSRVGA